MTKWIAIMAPGSDIGQAITRHLLEQGYSIIGLARPNSEQFLLSLDMPEKVKIFPCSYTDEGSVVNAFEAARDEVEAIDAFIHLVGGSLVSTPLLDLNLATFQKVMAVNVESAFVGGREAVRWMADTGGGRVIFFGSTTGSEPSSGKLAYGVAKAAVHNLTLSFALEASQYGVITNTIAPGYVMTQRHDRELDAKAEKGSADRSQLESKLGSKNVVGKIVGTEEILPVVDFLLENTAVQGRVIPVDLGQVGF